ncbi:MAG: signal recognition particle-docking protein FtsY [Gemmatimonadetes bacterium]|nr:signal recognition particle-docking protein FtsY [Gemmatimonadota bacterium]
MATAPGPALDVGGGLWARIKSVALTDVAVLVRGLDRNALDGVERVLAEADLGAAAVSIARDLEARQRRGELRREDEVRSWLREQLLAGLGGGDPGVLNLGPGDGPGVILLAGVNGAGKTTVAARLAYRLKQRGRSVLLAAADTYRAAAGEQLLVWAERLGIPCVSGAPGGDPAAVAFDAIEAATNRNMDAVIVDTAGRLHTQSALMDELKKLLRVTTRRRPGAPHETLLVLDGTVGQNAMQQGRMFGEALPLTGLVITKLDGTAKGGAVLAMSRELGVPVRFIGIGEGLEDLEAFNAASFVDRLLSD